MDLYRSSTLRQIEVSFSHEALMQRAGAAVAEWAAQLARQGERPILILAGPGNNGGDAFVAAHLLRQQFFAVNVVFVASADDLPTDAAAAYQCFLAAGGMTLSAIPEGQRWSLIIDGLFGIGLSRAPAGPYAELVTQANQLRSRDNCPLLALDCPSGLNADSGTAFQPCIQASHTLTFIAGKPGLLTADGPDHCGELRVAGLDLQLASDFPAEGRTVSRADYAASLQARRRNSHKGSFGNAGILGGDSGMLGAALLAGRAALKLGAGRVYLGLLDPAAPGVDLLQPELMLRPAESLLSNELHALACGPGLGQRSDAGQLLEQAIQAPSPLVLDADALNIVAGDRRLAALLRQRPGASLLTPHPAEAARLLACSVAEVQADRIAAARQLCQQYHAHVALKGCGTVIATVDGRWWINTSGNPGMATAGMGDVLSGMLVALLAQGWNSEAALLAAVHLHGAAADRLLAYGLGPIGMTAGDIIEPARQLLNATIYPQT